MGLSGITGSVKLDGADYNFNKWSASIKSKNPDTSGFRSGGFGDNERGVFRCAITAEGPYDGSMPVVAGQQYQMTLGYTEDLALVVTARISEVKPSNDYEDKPMLMITADSNGPFDPQVT